MNEARVSIERGFDMTGIITAIALAAAGALVGAAAAGTGVTAAPVPHTWTLDRVIADPGGVAPLYPAGAVARADGTVFVASSGGDDVTRIDPNGTITRLGVPDLDRPRDIALSTDGRLLILDTTDNELVVASTSGVVERVFRPGLKSAFGVAADAGGIYLADSYHARIIKIDKATGALIWQQQTCSGSLSRPRDVTVGSDGRVYAADTDHNRIVVLAAASGACQGAFGSGGAGPGQFRGPRSLTSDGRGGLYVAEAFNRRVQHVTNGGAFLGASSSNAPEVRAPSCVYALGATVGVCDTFEYTIHTYADRGATIVRTGAISGPRPVGGGFNQPFGVAFAPDGSMYVTDMFNHRVQKFAANAAFEREWGGFGTAPLSFTFPRGITTPASGDQVVVTDSENDRISYFTSTGTLIRSIRARGNRTGWPHQTSVATDGTLWVADTYKNRILHLAGDGTVLGEFTGSGRIKTPRGVAIGADGFVYVANSGVSRVEKYTRSGTLVATLATPGSGAGNVRMPWNLVTARCPTSGTCLYIADGDNNRVLVLTTAGAPVGTITGTGTAAARSVRGVAVHPVTGVVAMTDFYGNDVARWRP